MSVRRISADRRTLFRTCGSCGRHFVTTADTPFMRMLNVWEGGRRRQPTVYYCSETCKTASYKHRFDGGAGERRREREATRDVREKNRRYYAAHAEQERARVRARYYEDRDGALADMAYQRKKRKVVGR